MIVIPAIDLYNGECVRLKQGKKENITVYDEDPVRVAQEWVDAGTEIIHIVDLNRAIDGTSDNLPVIQKIVKSVKCKFELGGGLRDMEAVDKVLEMGIDRVVLGTAAVKNPKFTKHAIKNYGADKIAIGIDFFKNKAAIEGWKEVTKKGTGLLAEEMYKLGARIFIFTDIERDGMMSGMNIPSFKILLDNLTGQIIVSGGFHNMDDIINLAALKNQNLIGVIVGKALYEGTVDLHQVIQKLRELEGSC